MYLVQTRQTSTHVLPMQYTVLGAAQADQHTCPSYALCSTWCGPGRLAHILPMRYLVWPRQVSTYVLPMQYLVWPRQSSTYSSYAVLGVAQAIKHIIFLCSTWCGPGNQAHILPMQYLVWPRQSSTYFSYAVI